MSNTKILVVEDDADVRLGYQVLLTAHHFDIFSVADGAFAITEARKHQPDLIILDLGLPAGDGFVVMDRLRSNALFSEIPVIVVSALEEDINRERALKAGAKAYLQKPWNDDELLEIIRKEIAVAQPA